MGASAAQTIPLLPHPHLDAVPNAIELVEQTARLAAAVERLIAARDEAIALCPDDLTEREGIALELSSAAAIDISRRFRVIASDLGARFQEPDGAGLHLTELDVVRADVAELADLCRFFAARAGTEA